MAHNVKLTWKFINEVTGTIHNNKDKIEVIHLSNSIINIDNDSVGGSNVSNNYSINVGKHLVEQLSGDVNYDLNLYGKPDMTLFDNI